MPDFFPTPQLPNGLAEQTVQLRAQRGQYDPSVAIAQAIAGMMNQGIQGRVKYLDAQKAQNQASNELWSKVIDGGKFQTRQEALKNPDGTPKVDEKGQPVMGPMTIPANTPFTIQNAMQYLEPIPQTFVDEKGHVVSTAPTGSKQLKSTSSGSAVALSPQEEEALQNYELTHPGKLPPSILRSRGYATKFVAQAILKNPDYDAAQANLDYEKRKSYTSPSMVRVAAASDAIQPNLDLMRQFNKEMERTDIQLINKYGLELAAQKGSRAASRLMGLGDIISDEFQANFGQGSDAKLALGRRLLSGAKTQEQLSDAIELLDSALANRSAAFQNKELHSLKTDTEGNIVPQNEKPKAEAKAEVKPPPPAKKSFEERSAELEKLFPNDTSEKRMTRLVNEGY